VGRIVESTELPDGRYNILLRGLSRVRILEELSPDRPYRLVRAERLQNSGSDPALIGAWQQRLNLLFAELSPHLPAPLRDLGELTRGAVDAGGYADRITSALIADPSDS